MTAENPARIFRLPGKGAIEPGNDADLVVLHPDDVRPVPAVPPYWKVDNGIFEGLPHVPPRTVLQRGRLLARDGRFTGEPAGGRFVVVPCNAGGGMRDYPRHTNWRIDAEVPDEVP